MEVWYTARKRSDANSGEAWDNYIRWAQLHHLKEVVSLDGMLCPSLFDELIPDDWNHNVQQDYRTEYIRDLEYVIERSNARDQTANILAVIHEPEADPTETIRLDGFKFCGFDLLDVGETGISGLTNCEGFDKAFRKEDLSDQGLIVDYRFAKQVQRLLRNHYPEEGHADCTLWAVWRFQRDAVPSNPTS